MTKIEQIERALTQSVRPQLAAHGGGIETVSYENGVYRFRLYGSCCGCPSAGEHTRELVSAELKKVLPELVRVELDDGLTQEMWEQAMAILRASAPKSPQ